MDGRVSEIARYLERALMLRLFRPRQHVEILRLMKSQTGLRAKTTFGVRYDTGMARASGSPETSAFNTVLNAFTAFLGYRMTRRDGRYVTASEAWAMLGTYGGDDGLSVDQDRKAAEKAARMVGQVMTVERTVRGNTGVSFLARHYGPDVWQGDVNSCCDIRRQLAKFHTTAKLPGNVTPITKLREKAYAFSLTDSGTPVIGRLCTKVLELAPMRKDQFQNVLGIWNVVDDGNQYPNVNAGWMLDLLREQIPEFNLDVFSAWVEGANIETILTPPMCAPQVEAAVRNGIAAVDGDFIQAQGTGSAQPARERDPERRRRHRPRPGNSQKNARDKKAKNPSRKPRAAVRQQ